MSEPPTTPDYASPPFNHPKADLILRSCDGLDFRVSKFILEVSSDFFATMFEAGQAPGDELRDGRSVVPVQEDSGTLDGLLRIIYPTITPDLDEHPNRDAILEAALKYDMKEAIRVSTSSLRSLAPKIPLHIWIVAVRNRLEPEARVAASELLRQRISVLDEDVSEMGHINAGQYFRLLRYMRLLGKVEAGFTFCDPRLGESDSGPPPPSAPAGAPQPISQIYERIRSFADITCRSSDGQLFSAHKAFLALASPVISAMIASLSTLDSQEGGETQPTNDTPTLTFEEEGEMMRMILILCYPDGMDIPNIGVRALPSVVDAATKYEMTGVIKGLQRLWCQLSTSNPLPAYLLAVGRSRPWGAGVRDSARQLLDQSMDDYYDAALEVVSVGIYRQLLLYHRRCMTVVHECKSQAAISNHSSLRRKSYVNRTPIIKYSPMRGKRHVESDSDDEDNGLATDFAQGLRAFDTKPHSLLKKLETEAGISQCIIALCTGMSDGGRTQLEDVHKLLRDKISESIDQAFIQFIGPHIQQLSH